MTSQSMFVRRGLLVGTLLVASLSAGGASAAVGGNPHLGLPSLIPGTSFPGAGFGAIPDSSVVGTFGSPLDITFDVSFPAGEKVNAVGLTVNMAHTYIGDLDVVLIAPGGTEHTIFSRVGATTSSGNGDSSDLGGSYTFDDTTINSLWAAAGALFNGDTVASATFATSTPGGSGSGGSLASMNAAFEGRDPNGTWTLRLRDRSPVDIGTVTDAALTIDASLPPLSPRPSFDFDGDRMADPAIVRDVGGQHEWWIDGSQGSLIRLPFGLSPTDIPVPADYDGDGVTDPAVWRPSNATWYLQQSSAGFKALSFGVAGDDPTVVGDWDGDGKADPAVYRPGANPGDQGFFWMLNSTTGTASPVQWGMHGDIPIPADYDGDGKLDAAVSRNVSGQNQIWVRRSSDFGVEVPYWGLPADAFVPGDFDGDGRDDFMVLRDVGPNIVWWLSTRDGVRTNTTFGLVDDIPVTGDYDGDGAADIGVFRPSNGLFYILRSSDSSVEYHHWGKAGDDPLGNAYVR